MLGHGRLSAAEYLGIGRRRGKWALLCCLLGAAAGYSLALAMPARYTSMATIVWAERGGPGAGESLAARLAALRSQVLTSPRLQDAKDVELTRVEVASTSLPAFRVSCTGPDAAAAQRVCAGVVSVFQQENIRRRAQLAQENSNALVSETDEAKQKLDEQNAKATAFLRKHPEFSGDGRGAAENSLAEDKAQMEAAGDALRRARQERVALMESLQARQPAPLPTHKPDSANVQALEQELATEQASLVSLEARYTPDHPDVVKLKADIARLQSKIEETKKAEAQTVGTKQDGTVASEPPQAEQWRARIRELDLTIRERTQEEERLQQRIQASQARLANRSILEAEYKELTRDLAAAKAAYDAALAKRDAAASREGLALGERQEAFQIAEAASLPASPSFPNPPLFALGGAGGGLGVGLLVMLVGELRDKTLRTEGDIEHFLALPTLAVIPSSGESGGHLHGNGPGHSGAKSEKEESVLTDA